jgi:hypothetical protein
MLFIYRLIITAIILLFISIFLLTEFDDINSALTNKILLFTFVFLIQIMLSVIDNMVQSKKILIHEISQSSLNYAILAVVGYDTFKDLNYKEIFSTSSRTVKIVIMVMIVTMFMTLTKLMQTLFLYES